MKKRGQNQKRFFKIISIPLRVLGKARDLYIKTMTGCASRTHYSDAVSIPFPRSRSTSSTISASSSRRSNFDDDYSELIRAASVRSLGHKNEIDMLLHQQLQQQQQQRQAIRGLPKSSSVGMAKIDEIEEEEEGSLKKGSDFLYPRSRSYAVTLVSSKF